MEILKANYSNTSNKVLVKLSVAKKEPGAWVSMPNKAFTDGKVVTYKIYNLLTGKDINPDDTFALINFDERGSYKRFAPPCVYNKEKQLFIKWGEEFLPLDVADGSVVSTDKLKIVVEKDKVGNFDCICLVVSYVDVGTKTKYTMSFPCRLNDLKQDIEEMKMFLEVDDKESFVALFSNPPESKGDINKLANLPEDEEIQFLTGESIALKDGRTTMLIISESGEKYWANDHILNLLESGAIFPLGITRYINEKGKNRYLYDARFPEDVDDDGDLEWLLTQ